MESNGISLRLPLLIALVGLLVTPLLALAPDVWQSAQDRARPAALMAVTQRTVLIATSAAAIASFLGITAGLLLRTASHRAVVFWLALSAAPVAVQVTFRSFFIQNGLSSLGPLIDRQLLFTTLGTIVGLTHYLLPFALLILVPAARQTNRSLVDVAYLLGAGRLRVLTKVLVPLLIPSLLVALTLCFCLAYGAFVTPAVLGSLSDLTYGRYIADLLSEGRSHEAAIFATTATTVPVLAFVVGIGASRVLARRVRLGKY